MISIGSLILVHIIVIVIHVLIDDATPSNRIAYKMDKAIELMETGFARMGGRSAVAKSHVDHAVERIDELEDMLVDAGKERRLVDPVIVDGTWHLLEEAMRHIEIATDVVRSLTKEDTTSISAYTLALLVESTTGDIEARLRRIEEMLDGVPLKDAVHEFVEVAAASLEQTQEVVALYTIEDTIAADIRSDVQLQVSARRHMFILEPEESFANEEAVACMQKNDVCTKNSDCCGGLGLTCGDVILADGSQSRRCVQEKIVLCSSTCEAQAASPDGKIGRWSTPDNCRTTLEPQDDIPSCGEIVRDPCQRSSNEDRNIRYCLDI